MLRAAAVRAEQATSLRQSIAAGWSALHADNVNGLEVMMAAFRAWARAEDYGGDIPALGGVLRRRYTTPAEVAASLRRAADQS